MRGCVASIPPSRRRHGCHSRRDFHKVPRAGAGRRADGGVPLLVWGKTVYNADGTARTLGSTTGGPAEPAPFE